MCFLMKTTIDMSDALVLEVRQLATREHTSLRALVEEGLHLVLERRRHTSPFQLKDRSVDGQGLQAGVSDDNWDAIRELTYEGRGG